MRQKDRVIDVADRAFARKLLREHKRVVDEVAGQKQTGRGEGGEHHPAVSLPSPLFDQDDPHDEQDRCQSIERGIHGGQPEYPRGRFSKQQQRHWKLV